MWFIAPAFLFWPSTGAWFYPAFIPLPHFRQGEEPPPMAAALPRLGLRPRTPDAIGAALGAPVERRFCYGGGRRCIVLSLLFGVWVIGDAVFWRSPNAALCGGIGGAQRIREVGSATSLRLVAPPEVSAAHRLLAWADAVWVSAVPVLFREPMGGESGDGVTGDGGARGGGMRWGAMTRRIGWLTRGRRCP